MQNNQLFVISASVLLLSFALMYVMRTFTRERYEDLPTYRNVENDYNTVKRITNLPFYSTEDGTPLHTFAQNKCSPECCIGELNSGLSCDRGCVCLTEAQKQMLASHGYNQTSTGRCMKR